MNCIWEESDIICDEAEVSPISSNKTCASANNKCASYLNLVTKESINLDVRNITSSIKMIEEVFRDKTVLVTGTTGFLGKSQTTFSALVILLCCIIF